MENKKWFYEKVTDRIGNHILASTVTVATEEQIKEAKDLHENGNCPHTIVEDEVGWLYDTRSCAICGKGLGTV